MALTTKIAKILDQQIDWLLLRSKDARLSLEEIEALKIIASIAATPETQSVSKRKFKVHLPDDELEEITRAEGKQSSGD